MMHLYPETVDLAELKKMEPLPYWARDAAEASPDRGREVADALVASWLKELGHAGHSALDENW